MAENDAAPASPSGENVVEFRGKNDNARHAFNAWRWLNQVALDEKLTNANFRVAHALANFFNMSPTGLAWPKQENLARRTRLTRRCVIAAIDALEARGHLLRERERGARGKLTYRAIEFDARDGAAVNPRSQCEPAFTVESEPAFTSDVNGRSQCEPAFTFESEPTFTQERKDLKYNKYIHAREGEDRSAPKAREDQAHFESWWRVYPKRVAKEDARKAYDEVPASVDHSTRLAGALRYAREREGKDPQFTKHPANWLRKGCWSDHERPQEHANGAASRLGTPAASSEWIVEGSEEFAAWERYHACVGDGRIVRGKLPAIESKHHPGARGIYEPSRWPPATARDPGSTEGGGDGRDDRRG